MKTFFTLLMLAFVCRAANAQPGTIYRLVGTPGSTVIAAHPSSGEGNNGFRRPSIWRLVNADGSLGANAQPQDGATLQLFGVTLSVNGNIDYSTTYAFNIQIRSEFKAAGDMHLGMLLLNNTTLRLKAGAVVTLGWSINQTGSTFYYHPGYLTLKDQSAQLWIGSNRVASRAAVGESYLNANAFNVTANSGTDFTRATEAPQNTHIRTQVNAPNANISSRIVTIPTAPFADFPFFYNAAPAPGGLPVFALPVKLMSFNASKSNGSVLLNWSTAQELNSNFFELQRSTDGNNWTILSLIKAAGNSDLVRHYQFVDAGSFSGTMFYRIRMVDQDEIFAFSNIARLSFEAGKGKIFTYPNPASSFTTISSDKALSGEITVGVFHLSSGQMAKQQVLQNPGNVFRLGLEGLTPGNYIIKIYSGQQLLETMKLVKN